ncbi:1-phosphofructokinase [Bacillus sp. XF8]|uniref:1-phosphofructokinase n=1 Tax=Bacillus sp. XF8 TaxID=2819289 RepID=UPI001AA07C78|nr:1-phosphofructokinase [Bacillus sp. XF8]MBO1580017.1 1-phosphofructokinase [Bacillus sp. XF8]
MIATITLNPSVDMRYELDELKLHEVHRTKDYEKTAGGKGINVSRVLRLLGEEITGSGLLGGRNGDFIREQLKELLITDEFVSIKEETRNCFALVTKNSASATEVLEAGPAISEDEIALFIKKYEKIVDNFEFIVASGSLPNGIPKSFYKQLAQKAAENGRKFILDTSGETLSHGIQGKPFLIKPNKQEICQFLQKQHVSQEEMVAAATRICRGGVQYVLLSLGKEGAILITKDERFRTIFPEIDAINSVGSGDAMVAGITYALAKGYEVKDALRFSAACGMANAAEQATGYIQPQIVEKFYNEITIV